MELIEIWLRPVNNGDGSASINAYLTKDDAETAFEEEDEGFAEDGITSIEVAVGSKWHKEAIENSDEINDEYGYLRGNFYETRSVGTGARSDKTCAYCGEKITKGVPHDMNHFYPEFSAYPTHKKCTQPFITKVN